MNVLGLSLLCSIHAVRETKKQQLFSVDFASQALVTDVHRLHWHYRLQ